MIIADIIHTEFGMNSAEYEKRGTLAETLFVKGGSYEGKKN